MEAGATQMNVQQTAQELGLTPGQVVWAYNQLMKEGWFHVRTAQKTKGKMKVKQTVPQPQTGEETETEEGASEESDQVFEPPPE
jgi:predicted transcriptional regulator